MAVEVKMPQLSDTMHDGKILSWFKKEGDEVSSGDVLAEVETDKADLEIECFDDGTLLKIVAPAGEKVPVGSVIAVVGEPGEDVSNISATKPKTESAPAAEKEAPAQEEPTQSSEEPRQAQKVETSQKADDTRIKISPLARNFAQAKGVNISSLTGSGEGGRIVKKDVEAALASAPASTPARPQRAPAQPSTSGLSKMRKAIADRMVESKTTIPHFYMTTSVVVDDLMELRSELKALPHYEGITFNHLVIKAVAMGLRACPKINSAIKQGSVVNPGQVNIGIVTALEDGLLIPVLKGADELSLSDIVHESQGLIKRARAGKPKPDDLVGATFSISNVGRFDVDEFSAIISPGQGGILAVSAIKKEPVVVGDEIVAGNVMRLTLSVDHRIIDGVDAAEFVTELNKLLSKPFLLLA